MLSIITQDKLHSIRMADSHFEGLRTPSPCLAIFLHWGTSQEANHPGGKRVRGVNQPGDEPSKGRKKNILFLL